MRYFIVEQNWLCKTFSKSPADFFSFHFIRSPVALTDVLHQKPLIYRVVQDISVLSQSAITNHSKNKLHSCTEQRLLILGDENREENS